MDAGWIASTDPATGRTFYANRYTRTTQWDPPPGWESTSTSPNNNGAEQSAGGTTVLSDIAQARGQMESMGIGHQNSNNHSSSSGRRQEEDVLPDGWEEMTDAATGRKF